MKRKWTDEDLISSIMQFKSIRAVIQHLGLIPAGGNYIQVKQRIQDLKLDTSHFTGKAWNKNLLFKPRESISLEKLLVQYSRVQSYKLKHRLFKEGIKKPECEICGWSKQSKDGRIPIELDHINGIREDNRLSNLRILCPNCHSLQLTHRGKNKKRR